MFMFVIIITVFAQIIVLRNSNLSEYIRNSRRKAPSQRAGISVRYRLQYQITVAGSEAAVPEHGGLDTMRQVECVSDNP
jgi:hypothetical protein